MDGDDFLWDDGEVFAAASEGETLIEFQSRPALSLRLQPCQEHHHDDMMMMTMMMIMMKIMKIMKIMMVMMVFQDASTEGWSTALVS